MLASKQSFVSPGIVGLDLLAMAGEVCAVRGIHTAISCWNWRPGQANKQAQHATTELQRILPHAPRSPWPAPRAALAAVHRRPLPRQAVPHAPVHRPRIACLDRAAPRGGNRSAGCVRASKPSLGPAASATWTLFAAPQAAPWTHFRVVPHARPGSRCMPTRNSLRSRAAPHRIALASAKGPKARRTCGSGNSTSSGGAG